MSQFTIGQLPPITGQRQQLAAGGGACSRRQCTATRLQQSASKCALCVQETKPHAKCIQFTCPSLLPARNPGYAPATASAAAHSGCLHTHSNVQSCASHVQPRHLGVTRVTLQPLPDGRAQRVVGRQVGVRQRQVGHGRGVVAGDPAGDRLTLVAGMGMSGG